ncbi:hypothetical protein AVEN_275386-1 [Araneus ventricosus]|uniref:Uncharacterized protein n=1 Tax=Araneus ventricosus TaxID=182803 RepID=A0A4Y2WYQ1_ARAVE|nr:hypothetical protein AVEN_275386-1 [Araneus ventricosus]
MESCFQPGTCRWWWKQGLTPDGKPRFPTSEFVSGEAGLTPEGKLLPTRANLGGEEAGSYTGWKAASNLGACLLWERGTTPDGKAALPGACLWGSRDLHQMVAQPGTCRWWGEAGSTLDGKLLPTWNLSLVGKQGLNRMESCSPT